MLEILVTNDDGIDSPGIYALVKELRKIGNITVVAPDRQQSAVGHSLSVSKPLRITKFLRDGDMFGYAINGTPTDCVKLAISTILTKKPDIVVSGINHGQNTSINILYSGTVSAATEGMLCGIKSFAVSIASHSYEQDCSLAAAYSRQIIEKALKIDIPKDTLLNINIPASKKEEIKGIKITKANNSIWIDKYEKRIDPFGREYYWFAGDYTMLDKDADSDDQAVNDGYISITPIHFNFTNLKFLDILKNLETDIIQIIN